MLADHVSVDGLGVQVAGERDLGAQARGVQAGARTDDARGVVAGEVPKLRADHVAGVGDRDQDAVEARIDNAVGKGAAGVRGKEELAVAVASGQRDLAGGVNDDVAARKLLIAVLAVDDLGVVRAELQRVAQVLRLGRGFDGVDVAQVELVRQALQQQAVRHMGAHVAHSHNANGSRLDHYASLLVGERRGLSRRAGVLLPCIVALQCVGSVAERGAGLAARIISPLAAFARYKRAASGYRMLYA